MQYACHVFIERAENMVRELNHNGFNAALGKIFGNLQSYKSAANHCCARGLLFIRECFDFNGVFQGAQSKHSFSVRALYSRVDGTRSRRQQKFIVTFGKSRTRFKITHVYRFCRGIDFYNLVVNAHVYTVTAEKTFGRL